MQGSSYLGPASSDPRLLGSGLTSMLRWRLRRCCQTEVFDAKVGPLEERTSPRRVDPAGARFATNQRELGVLRRAIDV